MSQTIQQKQTEYFTKYAGYCLKIWNSIVGQQITHYRHGPGTVVKIRKFKDGICVEVQFAERPGSIRFEKRGNFVGDRFSRVFTHLTLPREVEKELETRYWDFIKEDLIYELRNLASHASIDQSTFNTFDKIYDRLMTMNQKRKLSEQTIQEINGHQKILMDRKRFSDLSEKAMNPDVRAHFPLQELDEGDIQLVGKWHHPILNNLDRTSLIKLVKTDNKAKWELGRLLSARSAEKVARDFYQYEKEVKDVSITQIDKNEELDWRKYDLDVEGFHVDVKNSRRSRKSEDRYTEHCVPEFKRSRKNQNVTISGVLSPYLWPLDLLDRKEHHGDAEIIFLGETDIEKQSKLKRKFNNDLVDFVEPNSANKHFLPPWIFDYPEYVYMQQNKARKKLKDFTNLASLKGVEFKFNPIPVGIAADIDLTEILDNETLDLWERNFLDQLPKREEHRLSLPFLFLTILTHFLGMADSSETVSDSKPDKYRKFLFYKKEERNNPLGIYDPLKTIDSLIKALGILWTAESESIRKFCKFRLVSFNILQGKSNPNDSLWTTLIAYCGGRLEDGSACGKNPLVLGDSERCKECGKLICPDCCFCCKKCREERSPTGSTYLPPAGDSNSADASETGGSDGYPPY